MTNEKEIEEKMQQQRYTIKTDSKIKIKKKESDHETPRRMVTQRNGALGHLLAQGASTGLVVIHACVCVCMCLSRRQYTCTD